MKPFKSIDEQVDILKDKRMVFLSEEQAKLNLMRYGYYEIINGYKDLFLEDDNDGSKKDLFEDGTTFELLFELFMFDMNLRQAIFSSLTEFELSFRTALAYTIAEEIGVKEKDYLNKRNFRPGHIVYYRGRKERQRDQLLRKLNKIIQDDIQPMKHYREKHKHVPPWIALKGTSFGNIVILFRLLKGPLKNNVISLLYGIPVEFIEDNEEIKNIFADSLRLFLKYRNRSAHSGRIYNYQPDKTDIRYSNILHDNRLQIKEADYRTGKGKNDIRILLATLELLSNKRPFVNLYTVLSQDSKELNKKYPGFTKKLSNEMNIDLDVLI